MGCMLYGAVWLYAHTALYGAVWRCMAVWRRGEGVTMRVCCMEPYSCIGSRGWFDLSVISVDKT